MHPPNKPIRPIQGLGGGLERSNLAHPHACLAQGLGQPAGQPDAQTFRAKLPCLAARKVAFQAESSRARKY